MIRLLTRALLVYCLLVVGLILGIMAGWPRQVSAEPEYRAWYGVVAHDRDAIALLFEDPYVRCYTFGNSGNTSTATNGWCFEKRVP